METYREPNVDKVTIISLYPVSDTGGGESYTLNCAASASFSGLDCELVSPCEKDFCSNSSTSRFSSAFNRRFFANGKLLNAKQESFREVISDLSDCRYVWVHQYLASKSVFDILINTHPAQVILFTNLGFEQNAVDFWIRYGTTPNHLFVEISKYSASRTKQYASNVIYDYAGVWQKQVEKLPNIASQKRTHFVSVNRVLTHKAVEVTIDALSENDSLVVIGPDKLDDLYEKFLNIKATGKKVDRIGEVSSDVRNSIISNAVALISSSSTETYRSIRLPHSELLGLVLLEALLNNTIPISSSQPALAEVMNALGLDDFIYPERDSVALNNKMKLVASLSQDKYMEVVNRGRSILEKKFLWDNFWPRLEKLIYQEIKVGVVQ
jgi:glycosyltransferase involved in cell wall biosynthesis